jgi:hypothetical protein
MADGEFRELGHFAYDEARAAFESFPWDAEITRAEELDAAGESIVGPDMTFTTLPYHFNVSPSVGASGFDVELCVPRQVKVLGLFSFTLTKFFTYAAVSRAEVDQLLSAFLRLPLEQQMAYFAKIQNA